MTSYRSTIPSAFPEHSSAEFFYWKHRPRRAAVSKKGRTWITTCYNDPSGPPLILHWTSHKIALQQALIWVGLNR